MSRPWVRCACPTEGCTGIIRYEPRDNLGGACSDGCTWPPSAVPLLLQLVESAANGQAHRAPQVVDSIRPPIYTHGGRIEFRSPCELANDAPEDVPWLWTGYLAEGALTVFGGREKSGKSTLAAALCRSLLDGSPFLGLATAATSIVYLSEEPTTALLEKLRRFGLATESERFRLLTRDRAAGRPPWPQLVAQAAEEALRIGAKCLAIDTLTFWADLPPEAENDAGAMAKAVRPMLDATTHGLSVLANHHLTKSSGELRGSTALGAAADILLTIHREPERPTRRRLDGIGRYQATPSSLLLELEGDEYQALGAASEVSAAERRRVVLEALPDHGEGLTQEEIASAADLSKQRVAEALGSLGIAVIRTGDGHKNSPYRYRKPP